MQTLRTRGLGALKESLQRSSAISFSAKENVKPETTKSWEEIPGPPYVPFISPLLQYVMKSKMADFSGVKLYDTLYKTYGPIVKVKGNFGTPDMVVLFDPDAIEYVLRSENTMPIRPGFDSLAYYRQRHKNTFDPKRLTGLITDHGENWKEFRSKTNSVMLQPKTIKLYAETLENVATDLVARIKSLRDDKNMILENLDVEMNLWALESIGVVALGTRLNCFDPNLPADSSARKLIQNIHDVFQIPGKLDFGTSLWRIFSTPGFKRAMRLYEEHERLTKYFIDKAIKNMEESKNTSAKNSEAEKPILEKLLEIDVQIAHVMASDMLMAGVDTSAHTTLATLYLLATNPEKQKKLREEIRSKQARKPYLRACIKESMRMLPVVTGNARTSTKEYNLMGYKIPKGVMIGLSHQYLSVKDDYYPRPDEFIPERWIVDKNDPLYHGNAHPFVTSPFGFGVRMCIGRRIAELELETIISKLVENFQIDWKGGPLQISSTSLNYVRGPFNFVFNDL